MDDDELEYVGFWLRVVASLIDTVLLLLIIVPVTLAIIAYGGLEMVAAGPTALSLDFLLNYLLPAVVVIIFWKVEQATPGKMVISAKIVDAETGGPVSTGKLILRYIGYFLSIIPLLLGIIWVAFDKRKQGWHDKIAGTVVVRQKK